MGSWVSGIMRRDRCDHGFTNRAPLLCEIEQLGAGARFAMARDFVGVGSIVARAQRAQSVNAARAPEATGSACVVVPGAAAHRGCCANVGDGRRETARAAATTTATRAIAAIPSAARGSGSEAAAATLAVPATGSIATASRAAA